MSGGPQSAHSGLRHRPGMARITRTIEISAERPTVWAAVADLEGVADWNPNVAAAECPGNVAGVGAVRRCSLRGGGTIDEVVSEWQDGTRLRFAIGNHGGIRSADMGFDLAEDAVGTRATAVADYHLAFGPLGPVLDRMVVRHQMTRMLDAALAGLKNTIEATTKTQTKKERTP